MLDMTRFRIIAPQKFAARGKVIKQRSRLNQRTGRFARGLHGFNFAAVNYDFSPFEAFMRAGSHSKSTNARDTRYRFSAKTQGMNPRKIESIPNFARSMSLQAEHCIVAIHADAVVHDANK